MKKIFLVIAVTIGFCFLSGNSYAGQNVYESINSTAVVKGVACSSGTARQLDSVFVAGYNRAWVRVQNHDSTSDVYIGFTVNVSTITANANLGEKITPTGNAVYNVGKDIAIFCKSSSTSGATYVSIAQFGY